MNKTIMIVEDEQCFQDLYAFLLEGSDYEIIPAFDGDDALSKLKAKLPDLIILDMVLNMIIGDTFLLQLKSNSEYADIPVIITSSMSEIAYKIVKDLDPEIAFLDKTFTKEKLIEEVKAKIG